MSDTTYGSADWNYCERPVTVNIYQIIQLTFSVAVCVLLLSRCVEYVPPNMACTESRHCFRGQICDQQLGMCIPLSQANTATYPSDDTDIIELPTDTIFDTEELSHPEIEEIQDPEIFDEPEEEIQDTQEFSEPEEDTEEEIEDTEEDLVDSEDEIENLEENLVDSEDEIEDSENLEENLVDSEDGIEDTENLEENLVDSEDEIEDSEEEVEDTEDEIEEEVEDTEEEIEDTEEEIEDTEDDTEEEVEDDIEEEVEEEIEEDTGNLECEFDSDCINDLFCDGEEHCNEDAECLSGSIPCPLELCDEENSVCLVPGFMVEQSLSVENNSIVDSFNSTTGEVDLGTALAATNSTAANALQIDNSTFAGTLFAGPGSNINTVISLTSGGEVTGHTTSLLATIPLIAYSDPDNMPRSENQFRSYHETVTWAEDHNFKQCWVTGGTIIITENVRVLCTTQFVLEDTTVEIRQGASLHLYSRVFGYIRRANINNSIGNPEQLKISALYNFKISEGSEVYATINLPSGDLEIIDAVFHGTFQAETAIIDNSDLYMDEAAIVPR